MQPIFWPGLQYHPKSLMVSLGSLSSFSVQLPGLAVTLTCQGHTSCKALIFALIFLPCLQILRMPLLYSARSSGSITTITDLQYLQWSLILSNVSVFCLYIYNLLHLHEGENIFFTIVLFTSFSVEVD